MRTRPIVQFLSDLVQFGLWRPVVRERADTEQANGESKAISSVPRNRIGRYEQAIDDSSTTPHIPLLEFLDGARLFHDGNADFLFWYEDSCPGASPLMMLRGQIEYVRGVRVLTFAALLVKRTPRPKSPTRMTLLPASSFPIKTLSGLRSR